MTELTQSESIRELQKYGLARRLLAVVNSSVIGFEDAGASWHIIGITASSPQESQRYEEIVASVLGNPIKKNGQPVNTTVPHQYIELLNRMNGFLSGGICFREGLMDMGQIAHVIEAQQGGCTFPPINLGNQQSFYAKTHSSSIAEVVRICPHFDYENPRPSSIEYMLHFSPSKEKVPALRPAYSLS